MLQVQRHVVDFRYLFVEKMWLNRILQALVDNILARLPFLEDLENFGSLAVFSNIQTRLQEKHVEQLQMLCDQIQLLLDNMDDKTENMNKVLQSLMDK